MDNPSVDVGTPASWLSLLRSLGYRRRSRATMKVELWTDPSGMSVTPRTFQVFKDRTDRKNHGNQRP